MKGLSVPNLKRFEGLVGLEGLTVLKGLNNCKAFDSIVGQGMFDWFERFHGFEGFQFCLEQISLETQKFATSFVLGI